MIAGANRVDKLCVRKISNINVLIKRSKALYSFSDDILVGEVWEDLECKIVNFFKVFDQIFFDIIQRIVLNFSIRKLKNILGEILNNTQVIDYSIFRCYLRGVRKFINESWPIKGVFFFGNLLK